MTREEAIQFLKNIYEVRLFEGKLDYLEHIKMHEVIEILSEETSPVPDPDTGLVPCGCGGKPEEGGLLFDTGDYFTSCRECGTLAWCVTQKDANKAWNTAMGWRVEG